jgi:hypothetical protein
VLWSILWGAIAGTAFGYTSHAFTGGTRDFSSRSSIVAGRYDVLVEASVLEQARTLLQGGLQPADTVVVERPPTGGPTTGGPTTGRPATRPQPAAAGDTGTTAPGPTRPPAGAQHPAEGPETEARDRRP